MRRESQNNNDAIGGAREPGKQTVARVSLPPRPLGGWDRVNSWGFVSFR
jgi:hypothetical protein